MHALTCHYACYVVHLVGSRAGLGMNDPDSPLWASDHFAVVADLELVHV